MLKATDIWKRYSDQAVLRGASISVSGGSATVIVGPSGSGKSTLLRSISLIETPDSGRVEIDGTEYFNDQRERRGAIPWPAVTVVLQQLFLWPHLTLRENIELPARLRGRPLHDQSAVCETLGIQEHLRRYPNEVSIGQRQRAAVARAMMLDPKYLLLDEITSSLDVEQIESMLCLLELKLADGVGLIVVTHHLGFARSLMRKGNHGQFAFIDAGLVVEQGNYEAFEHPQTTRLEQFRRAMLAIA